MRDDTSARERVLAFAQTRKLMEPGQRVLVGVGGGLRSVGLMALLASAREELGLDEVAVASIEPVLDEDTDAAEMVADVGRLARVLGLDFYATRPSPTRGQRVDVLGELVGIGRAHGFHRVALGHTRDDDAVRVLCELGRGGVERIRGLGPRVRGGVVRPFLVLSDAEAMRFALPEARGWSPGPTSGVAPEEDRVRREVLPRLRVIFPDIELHLQALGRQARAQRRHQIPRAQRARG